MFGDQAQGLLLGHGATKIVALVIVTGQLVQHVGMALIFHALNRDFQPQPASERQDCFDDFLVARVLKIKTFQENPVDLELVDEEVEDSFDNMPV